MNRRLLSFNIIFLLLNLSFIPLMSLYGLRVCPVLSVAGFAFGCYYSATYVLFVLASNGMLINILKSTANSSGRMALLVQKHRMVALFSVYILASGLAILAVQFLLQLNHITANSRAPEILALASLLLGITQAYGLNWVFNRAEKPEISNRELVFNKLWRGHVTRIILPIFVASIMLLHFLVSQSYTMTGGHLAPIGTHDQLIEQTSIVVGFVLAWMFVTFYFHFLSERDHVKTIQRHLAAMRDLDFSYRSHLSSAWGLWSAILSYLNSFSKTMGERTRLLKNFSRFVSAGVAERALTSEITESAGVNRDLTVIMIDIRNFTSMSEVLAPREVVTLLNEYFSAMLDVASSFHVTIDKFIGDGILAYVEGEESHDRFRSNENQLAVSAALAMLERLESLNVKLKGMGLPSIKIGIGVYRGPIVIGLIGSEAKLQHTIIGGTVNRAARLESLCKELGVSIVLSADVIESLSEEQKDYFRSFGKVKIKGISEQVEVYGGPFSQQNSTIKKISG